MQVSPLCLGAMMFGAWGEPDHDTSIGIIHAALDAGINFIDTADVYSQGESEIIVGKALAGGRRDDVVLATKVHGQMGVPVERRQHQGRPEQARKLAALDRPRRSRTACAGCTPTGSTSTRYTAPTPTPTSRRPWARSPICSGRARSARSARRPSRPTRWSRRSGSASGGGSAGSSPSSRRTRCWFAASRPTCCRWPQRVRHGRAAVEPAGRRLADRPVPQGPGAAESHRAAAGCPARYDLSTPENQRKLDAADALGGAGRRGRAVADPPGARVRPAAPGGHRADHRPAHARAAGIPARRGRRRRCPRTSSTGSTRSCRRVQRSREPIRAITPRR